MPSCYIIISENVPELSQKDINRIRLIIARGLNSKSRYIDESHLSTCILHSKRNNMLADIEVEINAQLYLRRLISRDKRAHFISKTISEQMHLNCATWINLHMVGYSRTDERGNTFYSDSDNKVVRFYQKITNQISDKV